VSAPLCCAAALVAIVKSASIKIDLDMSPPIVNPERTIVGAAQSFATRFLVRFGAATEGHPYNRACVVQVPVSIG